MNGTKEEIRDIWIKTENTVRRNKKAAIIAVSAIALLVAGLFFYSSMTKKVHVDEHENEKAREETAVVHLSKEAQKASGVEVMAVALEPFSAPIEATAAIELDGDRVAKISARTSGRLVKIAASQGDAVKTGQALAWFDSPELGQAWAEYVKAKGRTDLAQKNLQREKTLFEKKISPEKDVIRALQELAEAEADLSFARKVPSARH
jgi:cobalt-zinc-cadmium efflux system membrane fusion protein